MTSTNNACGEAGEKGSAKIKNNWILQVAGLIAVIGISTAGASRVFATGRRPDASSNKKEADALSFSSSSAERVQREAGLSRSLQSESTVTVSVSIAPPVVAESPPIVDIAPPVATRVFDFGNGDDPSPLQVYQCGPEGQDVTIPAGNRVALQQSSLDHVCILKQAGINGRTLARSYNGGQWEARTELHEGYFMNPIGCDGDSCALDVPADGHDYQLISYQQEQLQARQDVQREHEIARFLIQTTFGPRQADIDNFPDSYEEWIQKQMDLPPSSHRKFWRQRLNWPSHGKPKVQNVCNHGSRWSKFAFGPQDVGKVVRQEAIGDWFHFKIDGVTRFMARTTGKWGERRKGIDGLTICGLLIHGFQMDMKKDICTGGGKRKIKIPKLNFPKAGGYQPGPQYMANFTNTCPFQPLVGNVPVSNMDANVFMGQPNSTDSNCQCTPPPINNPKVVFRKDDAEPPTWYRYEEMNSRLHNTPEEPDPTGCISVRPSPFTRASCTVVQGECRGKTHVPSDKYKLSCGSPGEVQALPVMGAVFKEQGGRTYDYDGSIFSAQQGAAKTIWLHMALFAEDQLRQRMAFALSGIFVADLVSWVKVEPSMAFYDIFVRNAFTNYLDVMTQVTYSWPMAEYLTYGNSASYAYTGRHADENYARELMQLFTLGVFKLHMNGTVVMDSSGEPVPTYDQDDVETMARVWTGLTPKSRENGNGRYGSMLDPLIINAEKHDQFPKMNLDDGYIGDGFPLCYDFPSQDYLHRGTTYEFVADPRDDHEAYLVTLQEGSPLYEALCNRQTPSDTSCNFQPTITLTDNVGCQGVCDRQTLDIVAVGTATYRYVGRPCVTFPFYNEGEVANRFCLDPSWKTGCCGSTLRRELEWTGESCSPMVKIFPDGKVALVHNLTRTDADVKKNNLNLFRVAWDPQSKESLPTPDDCGPCTKQGWPEASCICAVEEVREPVFTYGPSRDEVLQKLHVGSVPPHDFANGEYVLHSEAGGVTVFTKAAGVPFDTDTIFAIGDFVGDSETKYFRNVVSNVRVVGAPHLKFRNPPMFNSVMRLESTDALGAHHEVAAVLEYLLKHPNTAPFVSYRFIQRFVTSNPSGGYVERVAKAFQSGRYESFGTGKWGDLAATIAAVLLDAEARTIVLDVDPTQGQLREPLIKMVHILRTMEFRRDVSRFIKLTPDIQHIFGQFPYEPPSVFSFFRPKFARSNSIVQRQALISPETQIVDYTKIFKLLKYLPKEFIMWQSGFIERSQDGDMQGVVDQMNTLFAGGRMPDEKLQMIQDVCENTPLDARKKNKKWEMKVYRLLSSFMISTEFQATNVNKKVAWSLPPPPKPELPSPAKEFKAIVFVDLQGGADSMNMLVPHSGCEGPDLYEDYKWGRRSVAIPKQDLLQIDVPPGQQKCSKFGMAPQMPKLHQLYQDKDLLWVSNVGMMTGPHTGEASPRGLNSHSDMFVHLERGWANSQNNTGVLGRVADVLNDQHYRTRSFATGGWGSSLAGSLDRSPAHATVAGGTAASLGGYYRRTMNSSEAGSSVFGQYFSHQIQQGLASAKELNSAMSQATTDPNLFKCGGLCGNMRTIAKLIQQHETLDYDRGFFLTEKGGWDTHARQNQNLPGKLQTVDDAIGDFAAEMRRQGLFDNVVIIMRTEFGRTHKDNGGKGTDHGWNGNYFVVGGSVKGGQVLGEYPKLRVHKPKYPWDSIYNGVFEWMGVLPHQMSEALPRVDLFDNLFSAEDLFESST